jgi:hypothetical protein
MQRTKLVRTQLCRLRSSILDSSGLINPNNLSKLVSALARFRVYSSTLDLPERVPRGPAFRPSCDFLNGFRSIREPLRRAGRAGASNPIRRRKKMMKSSNLPMSTEMPGNQRRVARKSFLLASVFICAVALILAFTAAPSFSHPSGRPSSGQQSLPSNMTPEVLCVVGFDNIKPNTRGTLTFLPNGLQFTTEKQKGEILTPRITDVFAGQESRQDVSGMTGTVVKAGIPYGGGRVVSLFSHKVEVLTVEFNDENGGFHGAIFVLANGKATELRNALVKQGAKTVEHVTVAAPAEEKK